MKEFIKKIGLFVSPVILLFVLALSLPTTPRASRTLLMAAVQKDSLLSNVLAPRIIFVGGSNLSFGLNSQMIKDSLNLNPINMGIHASIGMKYMIENTLIYIRKGDIIVLVPEYMHYYSDVDLCTEELMRTIFDVDFSKIRLLDSRQILNMLPFLPKYALSKFMIKDYRHTKEKEVYLASAFNKFGDVNKHWALPNQPFESYGKITSVFNSELIDLFRNFSKEIDKSGATLYISYPGLEGSNFDNWNEQIQMIRQELERSNLSIMGTPERYKVNESMVFDTPFHLNKKGVDYRTELLIEDIRKAMTEDSTLSRGLSLLRP